MTIMGKQKSGWVRERDMWGESQGRAECVCVCVRVERERGHEGAWLVQEMDRPSHGTSRGLVEG